MLIWMYKISARIGSVDGSESWTDLCHPAFAMAGALAWQVIKKLIKKRNFLVRGGRQHGDFLAQGLFPSVSCVLALLLYLLVLRSSKPIQTTSDSGQLQLHRKVYSASVLYFPLILAPIISTYIE